ncbi:MaoC family dehydratase [Phenylobacterium sp.]|jgi:acyl dehydratase|uniref:MaoC family dehydratase n=1 Tax=Phenylobacterium sp. TaxID=1871053 RepID=UPI002F427E25
MPDRDLHLGDLKVGDAWTGRPIVMTEAELLDFARLYDPQPLHADPEAARLSAFKGLIASGWHVAALVMRDLVDARPFGATPILGLGVDELRWLHPVRPGDTLHARREIVDIRRSRSKPDRGVVSTRVEVTNQDGVRVMTLTTLTQMPA